MTPLVSVLIESTRVGQCKPDLVMKPKHFWVVEWNTDWRTHPSEVFRQLRYCVQVVQCLVVSAVLVRHADLSMTNNKESGLKKKKKKMG